MIVEHAMASTGAAAGGKQPVVAMLAINAAARPTAPAVITPSATVSHGELDQKSNDLVPRLLAMGVRGGDPVAVLVNDPVEEVSAAFGIWKAGGVFVPLSPADPGQHQRGILQDAGVSCVISEGDGLTRSGDSAPAVIPEQAACLLYRPGVCGRFEGIVTPHRALVPPSFGPALNLTAADRVALVVDFAYDLPGLSLFHILGAGACVLGLPNRPALPPRKIAALLRDWEATILLAPAGCLAILARDFPWALNKLRLVLCDGPAGAACRLQPELLERTLELYGCAETGGPYVMQRTPGASGATVGAPATLTSGTLLYLLGEDRQPVPEGTDGEVYVASERLALGYHNCPERTAAAFLENPFDENGCRLYRTGEWARKATDGRFEHMGRRDGRILLRGLRIEPEEIRRAVFRYPGVQDVKVETCDPARGLVASVTPLPGQEISADEIRRFLADQLPAPMIPAVLVAADNTLEQMLCSIWREVLKREHIGVTDNFFDLGGNSMALVRVAALIKQRLHKTASLVTLLGKPTIRSLAEHLEAVPDTARRGP
jgi:non-ribosomal peptide synthetase component F